MTASYKSGLERKTKQYMYKIYLQFVFCFLKNIWKSRQKNEGEKLNINKQWTAVWENTVT